MILLSAAHVTKAFGVDEILKDVNFTLQDMTAWLLGQRRTDEV